MLMLCDIDAEESAKLFPQPITLGCDASVTPSLPRRHVAIAWPPTSATHKIRSTSPFASFHLCRTLSARCLLIVLSLFLLHIVPARNGCNEKRIPIQKDESVFAKNSLPGQRPNRSGQGIVFNQQKHTLGRILTECVLPLH